MTSLPLIKFRKNFVILNRWRQNDVKSAAWLQVIEPVTVKTWGRGWVVLVVRTKWRDSRRIFHSFHGDLLSKNMVRTAWGRTTSAVWSIFADLNRPLSPKLPDKDALSIHRPRLACFSLFSNLELFWRNNKTIIEFGCRRIWRILQISEVVITLRDLQNSASFNNC